MCVCAAATKVLLRRKRGSNMKKSNNARWMLIASMAIFGTLGPFVRNMGVSSGDL